MPSSHLLPVCSSHSLCRPTHTCTRTLISGWKLIRHKYIRSKEEELLSHTPDDGAIYSGPDRFIYDPDGGLATYFKKAQNKSVANFFFLPVSPLYLCAASLSANHTGPYNVENIVNRFRFGTRSHMSHAYQGRVSEGLFLHTAIPTLDFCVGSILRIF